MVRNQKLKAGIGAKCSTLIKFLHPSKLITDTLINTPSSKRLKDLVAVRREVKRVNRREQECIVFHHDTFPNQEIYCVEKFCKVEEEGASILLIILVVTVISKM